jgi:hypothetical protein
VALVAGLTVANLHAADDSLPSWNDIPAEASILEFV